jgi:hypothetical protein
MQLNGKFELQDLRSDDEVQQSDLLRGGIRCFEIPYLISNSI